MWEKASHAHERVKTLDMYRSGFKNNIFIKLKEQDQQVTLVKNWWVVFNEIMHKRNVIEKGIDAH